MNIGNNEIWRAINGYLNVEISSHGRVRNNKTGNILKGCCDSYGYNIVTICEYPQKKKVMKIHRLVCEAFNDNPNNNNIVDHIDRNKNNNYFENLRWVTQSENEKNKPIFKSNKSGYKGITILKSGFRVSWNDAEKNKRTKQFKNMDDAIIFRKEIENMYNISHD